MNPPPPPSIPAPSAPGSPGIATGDSRIPLKAGAMIGQYSIISRLGQGGFGITYRARHCGNGSIVVIKEHFPEGLAKRLPGSGLITCISPETEQRFIATLNEFKEEVTTLQGLEHPGIVPILASIEANGTAYYVMPFVEGEPLKLPEQATFSPERKAIEARQYKKTLLSLLYTLEYLGQHNIVHRDIKPENIIINNEGRPILLDFGSARQIQPDKVYTNIYTPDFCAPEQASAQTDASMSRSIGPWTDLYALGATFHYLITRLLPPKAELRTIASPDPYKPLAGRADLEGQYGSGFLQAIDRALQLDPKERWREAAEWRTSIEDGALPPPPRLVRRMRIVVGSLSFILALFCGFSFWALRERDQAVDIYNNSLHLTESMLYDFNEELADIPGATRLQSQMGLNLKNYLDSMKSFPVAHDAKLLRAMAAAWQNLGAVQVQQGNLEEATGSYQQASSLLQKLRDKDPGNLRYRYEHARTWLSLAEISRRNNNANNARAFVGQALSMLRNICREKPANPDYRCALGYAMGFTAALAKDSGDEDLRKKAVDEMLSLYRELVSDYPLHKESRKGLAYALQYRSSLAVDKQDFATALYLLNEEKEIFSALSAASPYRLSFKTGLATTYFNLGAMYRQMASGVTDKVTGTACDKQAMAAFSQCLNLVKELKLMDKGNAEYPRMEGSALSFAIDIYLRHNRPNKAEAHSKDLLQTAEDLLSRAPNNADYAKLKASALRGLAISHSHSGKRQAQATQEFQQYLNITANLAEKTPGNPQLRFMHANALVEAATHAQAVGKEDDARRWLQQAIALLSDLARQNPENATYPIHLKKAQDQLHNL